MLALTCPSYSCDCNQVATGLTNHFNWSMQGLLLEMEHIYVAANMDNQLV